MSAQSGKVNVVVTVNEGLPLDHWVGRATDTIINVGEESHPLVKEQAKAFKAQVFHVIKHYMQEAVNSSKTNMIAEFEQGGYQDIAEILRKI